MIKAMNLKHNIVHPRQSFVRRWRRIITMALGGFFIAVVHVRADSADSSAASGYRPYNETEIKEALQRPLALDDCIRIALSKNISLKLTEGDLMKAEAGVSGSYGKFLPVFTLLGSRQQTQEDRPADLEEPEQPTTFDFDNQALVGRIEQNVITGASLEFTGDLRRDVNSTDRFGDPPTRTENRGYTVTLTQPLLRDAWFKMARSEILLAKHARQAQEQEFHDAKLKTVFAAKQAFYKVLLQRELIKVHRAALARDSALVFMSESKMKAMLATRRDILSAEIRLAEDRAAYITSETEYQRALDRLKDIMGVPLEAAIALADVELSYSTEPLNEEDFIRHALQQSPLIRQSEVIVKSSRLQRAIAKNQMLPRLDLSIQYNGRFDSNTDQNRDVTTKDWEATLSLTYPFLDRAAQADAERAEIAARQEEDRLTDLQRQIVLNIRDIIRTTYSSVQEILAIKRSMEAGEQKVEFATTMFNLGRASNFDVTDAQEALLRAQTSYVRKLVEYQEQLALLETLTGRAMNQTGF